MKKVRLSSRRKNALSRRKKLHVLAAMGCGFSLIFNSVFSQDGVGEAKADIVEQSPILPAVFATGGSGRYVDSIQWLQWADYSKFQNNPTPNVPVLNYGQTKNFVNKRDLGDAGELITTCQLSNYKHLGHPSDVPDQQARGPLVATIPGAWAGDALDNLYNIGGPGQWKDGSAEWHEGLTYPADYVNRNQMAIGLANGYAYNGNNTWDGKKWGTPGSSTEPTGYAARVSVDYSCKVELHTPEGAVKQVPVQGLVFADAEASSKRYGIKSWATSEWADEWVQASTDQNVRWRVLDTLRSKTCVSKNTGKLVTTNAEMSNGGKTLRLMPSDEECVYQKGAGGTPGKYTQPNGLGGPDAVMFMEGVTRATITLQGSGYSAVALGLIVATDFGDAPKSYGYAGSTFQPTWKGGEVPKAGSTDLFALNPQANMSMDQGAPRLGEQIDAEGYQKFSDDARGDDKNGLFDDEDGIDTTKWDGGIRTFPGDTHTETVKCAGVGKAAGWIDWNNNGTFDSQEKSGEVPCTGGVAKLTWTVPNDVTSSVRSVDGEQGSLPDSYMRVRITNDNGGNNQKPTGITTTGEVEDYKVSIRVPTLQLTKKVDGTYASSEVPALGADQWTLEGRASDLVISGKGRTGNAKGNPQSMRQGQVALSEASTNPASAGYESGQWTCSETPGTKGETYSSRVGPTTGGKATLTLNRQDRVSCEITNKSKPGSLVWGKVSSVDKAPLGGSEWTVSGPSFPGGAAVADCVSDGACAGLDKDPAKGKLKLVDLKWGTYSLREAKAPEGYVPTDKTFAFNTITPTNLTAKLQDSGTVADQIVDNAIVNEPYKGTVSWKKADEAGKALAGSEWKLTGPGIPADTVVEDCVKATAAQCTGGKYKDVDPLPGSFKVENIGLGSFKLTESAAPAGYKLSTAAHAFAISPAALNHVFAAAFVNEKADVPSLPLTGGASADSFLLWGGGLLALAAVGALVRRRIRRGRGETPPRR